MAGRSLWSRDAFTFHDASDAILKAGGPQPLEADLALGAKNVHSANSQLVFNANRYASEQLAVDAAEAAGGGAVIFEPGTYSFANLQVPSNVRLIGYPGAVTLTPSASGKLIEVDTSAQNVSMVGITIDMTGYAAEGDYAVYGDSVDGFRMEHCTLKNGKDGLHLRNATDVWIVNQNEFTNFSRWPLWVSKPNGLWITGNKSYSNGYDGIKIGVDTFVLTGTASIAYSGGNWIVTGSGTSFTTECTVGGFISSSDGNARTGTIASIDSDTQITLANWSNDRNGDNLDDTTGTATAYPAGTTLWTGVQQKAQNVFIAHNECYSNATVSSGSSGINVDVSSAENIKIHDNICRDNNGYGINVKMVYEGTLFESIDIHDNEGDGNVFGGITVQSNDLGATTRQIRVRGNKIVQGNANMCVRISGLSDYLVEGNELRNSASSSASGVLIVNSSGGKVRRNDIFAARGVHLQAQHSEDVTADNVIEWNTIVQPITAAGQGCVHVSTTGSGVITDISGTIVRHNTLTPNAGQTVLSTLASTTSPVAYQNYTGQATAIPTGTYGYPGDVIYNSAPTSGAGEYIGWVCHTAGTSGWAGFGAIA